jgi:xylulokinase
MYFCVYLYGLGRIWDGLVCVDENKQVVRNSIIWCDSRAVAIGDEAMKALGEEYCHSHLLNSPANFTASKLAWVKENEPEIYAKISKIMLPGDFISMQLTGEISTTISALSEGICWDFKDNSIAAKLLDYWGFDRNIIPDIKNSFDHHGTLLHDVALELNLKPGIAVTYKAGDQPNNALSLGVMNPGEVAATAGTSGVIYAVTHELFYDKASRVNTFAHVNHLPNKNSLGILMCINGTGILFKYIKQLMGGQMSYEQLNALASTVTPGSDGLMVLPFGNGAERIFNNKIVGSHFLHLNFNVHTQAHIVRAALEGIAYAFHYGFKIMIENGVQLKVIKAPKANLFLSEVFIEAFVNTTGLTVELYECDGSVGAAQGAAIGVLGYENSHELLSENSPVATYQPNKTVSYQSSYQNWESQLQQFLQS